MSSKISELPAGTALTGAEWVPVVQSGVTARVAAAYLVGPMVNVKAYGAVGDGVTDDTTAIQAAITSGAALLFPAGTYRCANLTQSTAFQRLVGVGDVRLMKNANGPILTCAGTDVELVGLKFYGDASTPTFTGHNLVLSGNNPRLLNCGSRWAAGRAVLATGNHVQIIGTNDLYQTADATGTGFDIEIGVSGTATLYHELIGVYSSQATGGLRFVDTGSHSVTGGQFGKYAVIAGTSPAGVNGGKVTGARILGDVTIQLASAILSANQFGAVAIAFAVGTSGCRLDASNVLASGATVTNAGNNNNLVVREIGSSGLNELKFGADSSTAVMKADVGAGLFQFPQLAVNNNGGGLKLYNAAGSGTAQVTMTSGNNLSIANTHGAVQVSASGGVIQLVGLPTAAAGLPAGAVWNDAGTVKIV